MLQWYVEIRRTEHIGELGFSMIFYQDRAISLKQSSCEQANFVFNRLFNTFQHCSTLFQYSYDVTKSSEGTKQDWTQCKCQDVSAPTKCSSNCSIEHDWANIRLTWSSNYHMSILSLSSFLQTLASTAFSSAIILFFLM